MESRFFDLLPALAVGFFLIGIGVVMRLKYGQLQQDPNWIQAHRALNIFIGCPSSIWNPFGIVRTILFYGTPLLVVFDSLTLTAWFSVFILTLCFFIVGYFKDSFINNKAFFVATKRIIEGRNKFNTLAREMHYAKAQFSQRPSQSISTKISLIFDFISVALIFALLIQLGSLWFAFPAMIFIALVGDIAFKAFRFPVALVVGLLLGEKGKKGQKVEEIMLGFEFNSDLTTTKVR